MDHKLHGDADHLNYSMADLSRQWLLPLKSLLEVHEFHILEGHEVMMPSWYG